MPGEQNGTGELDNLAVADRGQPRWLMSGDQATSGGQAMGGGQATSGEKTSTPEWIKFQPVGAEFSLSLPGSPTEKAKDGEAGLKIRYYKLKMGATEYQVVWFANVPYVMMHESPLDVLFSRGLEEIFKSAKHAGKKELVTTRQEDIALNGYHGRESTMESATDRIDARCVLARYDFITLAVLHPKVESSGADARRFLESLSLASAVTSSQGGTGPRPETSFKDIDTRPVALNRPRPEYTTLARKNGVQGIIRMRALIGVDGKVKDVRLLGHLPDGLDNEAVKAVSRMRFKPATKAGQNVEVWQILEVEFNLR
jgi:TonB family protein